MSTVTGSPGFFGPVTATLDWCEINYQFSHYIAELANSVSNLYFIYLAALGTKNAINERLPSRYIAGFTGFVLVGIGSFAFHATLLYEAQLADELPMIYVASTGLWMLFDRTPGFNFKSLRSRVFLAGLVIFNLVFTCTYYLYRNPIYHQVVFAVLLLGSTLRAHYLLKGSEVKHRVSDSQKAEMSVMFMTGAAAFALGFIIWNLDNMFCTRITRWKVAMGWPLAFLLEGHAWWHILTGYGSYLMITGVQYISVCVKDDYRNFTVVYSRGLPAIKRTDKGLQ